MKTANQLTFTTCLASLKLKANNLTRSIFDNIDWSFIHPLGGDGYLLKGRDLRPYFTIKAQPFYYQLTCLHNLSFTHFSMTIFACQDAVHVVDI